MSDQIGIDEAWMTVVTYFRERAHTAERELERLRESDLHWNEIAGMCSSALMDTLKTVVSPMNFDTAIRELGRRMKSAEDRLEADKVASAAPSAGEGTGEA